MKGAVRLAAWCLAIALVALPIVGLLRGWFAADRWPVTQLTVQAEFKHVSAAEIRAAVLPRLGKGFFALNLDAVQKAVAALPYLSRRVDGVFAKPIRRAWGRRGFVFYVKFRHGTCPAYVDLSVMPRG